MQQGTIKNFSQSKYKSIMVRPFHSFFTQNRHVLLGLFSGLVLGYAYWSCFGIYWGTYPLSSEWWVNCAFGGLFGGLVGTFIGRH